MTKQIALLVEQAAATDAARALVVGVEVGRDPLAVVALLAERAAQAQLALVVPDEGLDATDLDAAIPSLQQALAAAIDRLLGDRSLAQRMGRSARQRCEEKFSLEAHVQQVLREYREVLA